MSREGHFAAGQRWHTLWRRGVPPLIYLCACIIMRHSFFFLSYPLLSRLFFSLHRQTVSPDRLTEDTHTQKDAREMNKEKNETDERQHLDVTCVCVWANGWGGGRLCLFQGGNWSLFWRNQVDIITGLGLAKVKKKVGGKKKWRCCLVDILGEKMRQKLAFEQSNQTARKLHTTDERPEMLRDLK